MIPFSVFFIVLLSSFIVFFGIGIARKIGLLDKPHLYPDTRGTRGPVPTVQGLFLWLGVISVVTLFFPHLRTTNHWQAIAIGSFVLMISGFLDDCAIGVRLPVGIRFFLQCIVAFFAVGWGNLSLEQITFGTSVYYLPSRLGYGISMGWFLLCINAMNFFDCVNGQASTISTIGFVTIWLLIKVVVLKTYTNILPTTQGMLSNIQEIALVFTIFAGLYAIVERKPRGLIRDAGTLVYGFVLAYLSLAGGAKLGTMLVVLSLVIFDAIWVGIHRIFVLHKLPWKGDFTHLPHRLLASGRTKKEINIAMALRSLTMMILMLLQGDNKFNKIVIFLLMAVIFFGINAYIFWYKKVPAGLNTKKEV